MAAVRKTAEGIRQRQDALKAADAALKVLKNRKGFDWWWGDIDAECKRDIRTQIAKAIEKHLPKGGR